MKVVIASQSLLILILAAVLATTSNSDSQWRDIVAEMQATNNKLRAAIDGQNAALAKGSAVLERASVANVEAARSLQYQGRVLQECVSSVQRMGGMLDSYRNTGQPYNTPNNGWDIGATEIVPSFIGTVDEITLRPIAR